MSCGCVSVLVIVDCVDILKCTWQKGLKHFGATQGSKLTLCHRTRRDELWKDFKNKKLTNKKSIEYNALKKRAT